MSANPFGPFLDARGLVILDGGLATALEAAGHTLDSRLWSARLLIDAPEAIAAVHRAYLEAGADCIATASYQASFAGFEKAGFDHEEGRGLLLRSVRLAADARDRFWEEGPHPGRLRPLVAASVGPYGAYLADGSEYDGRYGLTDAALDAFHRERLRLLAGSDADLLGCETIPSLQEAGVLLRILDDTPAKRSWISFSCRDGRSLNDGSPIAEAAELCGTVSRVAGVGVNCTAPVFVPELLARLRDATELPVLAYPNSGEVYDAATKGWAGRRSPADWTDAAVEWASAGASVVGGCCRVGPEIIRDLRGRLTGSGPGRRPAGLGPEPGGRE